MAIYILLKNKLIEIDEYIVKQLNARKNYRFFLPEITAFYSNQPQTFEDIDYEKKRELGENQDILAKLIRTDSIIEFIKFVNRKNIPLNITIPYSCFETNLYLINNNPTLIEYAAFFGSIQIIQYLNNNGVEITPSLWIYSMHSNSDELFQYLEYSKFEPEDKTYETCFLEAVKCYHNNIAQYILNTKFIRNFYLSSYWYYENYAMIPKDKDSYIHWNYNTKILYNYIHDNPEFVDLLFRGSYLNINLNENEQKTVLLMAFEKNDKKTFQILSSNPKIDLNTKFKRGYEMITILSLAIEKGDPEIVEILVSNQSIDTNINFKIDDKEYTPLSWAIEKGYNKIVKCLILNQSTDPNYKFYINGNKRTVLTDAIENKNLDLIELIISNPKTDLNIIFEIEGKEYTPLSWAIEKGDLQIVKCLILNQNFDPNHKFYKNGNDRTALTDAIENKNLDLIELLSLNPKTDPNIILQHEYIYERTPISIIYEKNDIEMLHKFLSLFPNIDASIKFMYGHKIEKSLLLMVIEKNDIDMAKLLIKPNTNLNIKFLYENYIDINEEFYEKDEKTLLSMAIENDNFELVKLLLNYLNIDPNLKLTKKLYGLTQKQNTALHIALEKGNDDIIRLLCNDKRIKIIFE